MANILDGLTPEELEELTLSNATPEQPVAEEPAPSPVSAAAEVPAAPVVAPSEIPDSNSDEVQKYIKNLYGDPKDLQNARDQRDQAFANTNISTAASNLAKAIGGRGWNEVDTAPALKAIEDQAAIHTADKISDQTRKQSAVMNYIQQKRLADNAKMLNQRTAASAATSENHFKENQGRLKENNQKISEYRDELKKLRVGKARQQINHQINEDPVVKPSEQNLASLNKAHRLLTDTKVPLTPQILADAQQDVASALQLRGGGATEGKVDRTAIDTVGLEIAKLQQKYLNDPGIDLRVKEPKLVAQVLASVNSLKEGYGTDIASRKADLFRKARADWYGDPDALAHIDRLETASAPVAEKPAAAPAFDPGSAAAELQRRRGAK